MARTPSFDRVESDLALKDLGTLLARLRQNLNDEGLASSEGFTSPYEIQKFKANFEYARALLLRLEHESASIKVASNKQALQADLREKRLFTKELQTRIQTLDSISQGSGEPSESEEEADSETENNISYAPRHGGLSEGIDIEPTKSQEQVANLTSTLRSRVPGGPSPTSRTTGAEYAVRTENKAADSGLQTREKILTVDRVEQEQIMDSLLALTRELKTAQTTFHDSLEGEKKHLGFATEGLDKNLDGIDAAGKRMGTLRKMTEGKGWFGRMMLYAYIAGLWVLALVIVFVLPKLRF